MDMDWENYSRMRKSNGERQRTNSYRTQSYIDGNTVYKTDALPKRREQGRTQRQVQRTPQRKPVRSRDQRKRFYFFECYDSSRAVLCISISFDTISGEPHQRRSCGFAV